MTVEVEDARREYLNSVRDGHAHFAGVSGVKTTRQEELLFGTFSPMVRRLGQAATSLEQARVEVEDMLASCREADSLCMMQTTPPKDMVDGRSPATIWIDGVYERVYGLMAEMQKAHSEIARDCLSRELATWSHGQTSTVGGAGARAPEPPLVSDHPQGPDSPLVR